MARNRVQIDIDARNKTQRAFAQVNQSLSKTTKAAALLKRSFGGIAAAIGGVAVGRFINDTQKAINQLIDFSKLLGGTVTELSAFTFAMDAASTLR